MNTWRTLDDGRIEVNGQVPCAGAAEAGRIDASIVSRWGDLFAKYAAATGVPWAWLVGFCRAESWGDPNAISYAGARGLMQIMPFNFPKGTTDAQMLDPETNVATSARMLAEMRAHGADLPTAASMYNAGAASYGATWTPKRDASSPWGLYAQGSYVSDVVGAANYAFQRGSARPVPVMLLGDSLTLGYAPKIAAQLLAMGARSVGRSSMFGATSEGHSGYTIERIAGELDPAVKAVGRPRVIVFMGGTNDAPGNAPPEFSATQLGTALDRLEGSADVVVLCTIPPISRADIAQGPRKGWVDAYNAKVRELVAVRQGAGEAVLLAEPQPPISQGGGDGVHWSSTGYQTIADAIARVVRPIVEKLRQADVDGVASSSIGWLPILGFMLWFWK